MLLREQPEAMRGTGGGPIVLVAGGQRPEQLQWLSAAQEGLRYAGAKVVDVGGATAAGLALAILRLEAAGGLMISDDGAGRHRVVLRFWGPGGFVWSLPGELQTLKRRCAQPVHRPGRRFGAIARHVAYDDYAAHVGVAPRAGRSVQPSGCATTSKKGARPNGHLRIAVASSCDVARDWFRQLVALTGSAELVEVPNRGDALAVRAAVELADAPYATSDAGSLPDASGGLHREAAGKTSRPIQQHAGAADPWAGGFPVWPAEWEWEAAELVGGPPGAVLRRLRERVVRDRCDVGVWLGDQAETLCLLDEHARAVPVAAVVASLLAARRAGSLAPRVAVSSDAGRGVFEWIGRCGARVIDGGRTCETMSRTIWRENTLYGVGPGQRIWFRQPHGAADAVRAVLAVVQLLQERQRPLSKCIGDALAGRAQGGYDRASA